ncbi:MAG: transcriptional regulator [candidate division Zixibacteria bacterium HGW-Zixibacteria-1]|nr:MAG: transcriptional regulator [candidate division Zixibacteria bacterium HGW-Zixibacteria-1]
MKNTELLGKTYLCSGFEAEELHEFAAIARFMEIDKDKIIFFEGDPAEGFYVLLSGRVRIYKASPDGKEYTIHIIKPGQLFAEAAIFKGHEYPANCATVENSSVAYFPKDAFLNLLKKYPEISLKIIGSLASFVRDFNRQVEELSLKEVPARLASYLLNLAEQKGSNSVYLDSTKTELANRLGTISETLSRNLKKLSDLGVISVNGREISIIDKNRLNNIADGEKI